MPVPQNSMAAGMVNGATPPMPRNRELLKANSAVNLHPQPSYSMCGNDLPCNYILISTLNCLITIIYLFSVYFQQCTIKQLFDSFIIWVLNIFVICNQLMVQINC